MLTELDLEELKWEKEDNWFSYPIKHTSHSNEYFDENDSLIYFPYYSLHQEGDGTLHIQDPDGSVIFVGKVWTKEEMKIIMNSIINHKYEKE